MIGEGCSTMRNASLTSTDPKSTPDAVEISKLLEVNHGKQVEDVSERCWRIGVISLHKECKFSGSQSTPAKPMFGSGPIIVDTLLDTPVFSQPSVMLQMIIRRKTETTDIVYPGDWTCVSVFNVLQDQLAVSLAAWAQLLVLPLENSPLKLVLAQAQRPHSLASLVPGVPSDEVGLAFALAFSGVLGVANLTGGGPSTQEYAEAAWLTTRAYVAHSLEGLRRPRTVVTETTSGPATSVVPPAIDEADLN